MTESCIVYGSFFKAGTRRRLPRRTGGAAAARRVWRLAVSAVSALAPLAVGGTILQSAVLDVTLPIWGEVHLVSALAFDIGVYLIVVGLALDVVRSLGSGVDKHLEEERIRS